VLPLWDAALAGIDPLEEDGLQQRYDPAGPAWRQDVYAVPLPALPAHVLRLASELLAHDAGAVDVATALRQAGEVHEFFGRNLGYDEEAFPGRAWHAGWAA